MIAFADTPKPLKDMTQDEIIDHFEGKMKDNNVWPAISQLFDRNLSW